MSALMWVVRIELDEEAPDIWILDIVSGRRFDLIAPCEFHLLLESKVVEHGFVTWLKLANIPARSWSKIGAITSLTRTRVELEEIADNVVFPR